MHNARNTRDIGEGLHQSYEKQPTLSRLRSDFEEFEFGRFRSFLCSLFSVNKHVMPVFHSRHAMSGAMKALANTSEADYPSSYTERDFIKEMKICIKCHYILHFFTQSIAEIENHGLVAKYIIMNAEYFRYILSIFSQARTETDQFTTGGLWGNPIFISSSKHTKSPFVTYDPTRYPAIETMPGCEHIPTAKTIVRMFPDVFHENGMLLPTATPAADLV